MLFLTQIDSNGVASLFADFLSQRFDTFLVGFLAGSAETSVSAGTLKPGYHTIHARRPFLNGLRSVTKTLTGHRTGTNPAWTTKVAGGGLRAEL
jgi:hypothetical protein